MGWQTYPHGEIEEHADNLWSVQGSLPPSPLPRRMCVVRLSDGRLVIHSAVALDGPAMERLTQWGTPAILVVPSRYHRADAPAFKQRFPELRVLCPDAVRADVQTAVAVDGSTDELGQDPALQVHPLPGTKGGEFALIVRHGDGSASMVVTDAIFNVPHLPGFGGLIMKWIGSSGGPRVTRVAKMLMVSDRGRLAEGLRRLAATEGLARVLPAHGDIIEGDAARVLCEIADGLR